MRRQKDSEKLEQLYGLYEKKMYAVAYSILHNEWQAEDAVQDAFVRLFKNIRKIKNLEEMLSRLPESYKEVIMLRCVHQLSTKETAAVLEISEALVRKRQQRAIKKLRTMMGDDVYVRQRI